MRVNFEHFNNTTTPLNRHTSPDQLLETNTYIGKYVVMWPRVLTTIKTLKFI